MNSKFVLKTMGCKANQFESGIITENLTLNGFIQVKSLAEADYFILNSCSVTHKSDNEALYFLRNAKRENPNITNVLTGCVAQIQKQKLLELDYVDIVIGNDEKLEISKYIAGNTNCTVCDLMAKDNFTQAVLKDIAKTRIGLKIQDGCNSRCSYCIIPYARGKSRSADISFLTKQANLYNDHGYKEVVLTGIHIGQWGREHGNSLIDLLKEIEKTSIYRYRLGSLNPGEINTELLDFLQSSSKFCPHFHLSLQSACDKTLKSMNRFYKTEEYLEQIDNIRTRFKNPFLGSDIIVGFPGESDIDFDITYNNLKKSGLTQIHTFPYSIRQGTPAAVMSGQVPENIKIQRADKIKALSQEKHTEFINSNLGTDTEILIEKNPDKKTGLYKGVTSNYLTVYTQQDKKGLFNTIQKIRILKYQAEKLYGQLLL